MYGKQKEKQRKKPPKIPEKEYVYNILYTITVISGVLGAALTRGKNVYIFAYLANPERVVSYGGKGTHRRKTRSL